uniref:Uncharacterized protein n=1 Tax=Cucumis melo TaxID=3656 RepID=A0A9I9E340_CUCME
MNKPQTSTKTVGRHDRVASSIMNKPQEAAEHH